MSARAAPSAAPLALADIPIDRNADSALAQVRGDFEVFARDARFYLIEGTLGAEADPAKREALQQIPTSLQLPADDVARLRAHAKAALLRSEELRRLLRALR